jgi:chromosome transmission fidelity protein 1
VLNIWKNAVVRENKQTLYETVEKEKQILYESRETELTTDDLLNNYANTINKGRGALLLSVVGGKLSEGINFSDKLGRGVLIVGLPFPNIRSPVWQAKIKYIEQKAYRNVGSGSEESRRLSAKAAGRDFYENACMRAVNQCIGRAIRHRNDYAAIVLIDKRYGKTSIEAKLPGWIKQSLVKDSALLPAATTLDGLACFFRSKNHCG